MGLMRCPSHDVTFETENDHRKPGAIGDGSRADHPRGSNGNHCHPDCPVGIKERRAKNGIELPPMRVAVKTRKIA